MRRAVVDAMGPIEFLVMEFPLGRSIFDREVVAELSRLSLEGQIRVLDLLVIQKGADGAVEGFEAEDLEVDHVRVLSGDLADVLAHEDVLRLGASLEPGSVAGVVVWEDLWAVPLSLVTHRSGGRLLVEDAPGGRPTRARPGRGRRR
jgi:hypothetical protein